MRWLNLPNSLTVLRLVLTPFAIGALIAGDHRRALWLFIAAGLTDALDGFLARQFGWQTRVGAYLDPVADKTLLVSTYIAFGIGGYVPAWIVGLVIGRDVLILAMTGAALVLTSHRDFQPSLWGKISTNFQVVAAAVVIIELAFPETGLAGVAKVLLWLVAFWTVWSGIDYARRGLRIALKRKD